jgi:carbonic anhydrase/acetyltransferase-like protein (isoleucine patch superfamily)
MTLYALDGISPELPAAGKYWIAPDAVLVGKVTLKEAASVWFGSVIRGDNERITIGPRSNVQDNCTLHTDMGYPLVIGCDVTVGHNVMLHGCTVGDRALIGMGSTVLNGAKIGAGAVIGAGALVAEGKEIPEKTLVMGVPGKIARILSDDEAEAMLYAATHYVENWQRYENGLELIENTPETS